MAGLEMRFSRSSPPGTRRRSPTHSAEPPKHAKRPRRALRPVQLHRPLDTTPCGPTTPAGGPSMPATCVPSVLSVTGWVLASRTVSLHVGARTSGRCQSTRRIIYTPVAPPRQREAPARPPRARRARAGGARGARGRECSFLESDINSPDRAFRLISPPSKRQHDANAACRIATTETRVGAPTCTHIDCSVASVQAPRAIRPPDARRCRTGVAMTHMSPAQQLGAGCL